MIDLLDDALTKLLEAAPAGGAVDELHNAHVSFETPEHGHKPQGKSEVNLFLYETKENRELREPAPIVRQQNGMSARRRASLRVDCAYMVTTWAEGKTKSEVVTASHKLLGQAFNWLSRFPVISDRYLQAAGMTGQVFAPPTMVAQMDGAKSAGEFWHALGIPPRPYFNLLVTITMDLDQQIEDSIVTTIYSSYQAGQSATADKRVVIGGRVLDANGGPIANAKPVVDAWVRVDETGETQVTNELGQFVCRSLQQGNQYLLRARAVGLGQVSMPVADVPSPSGEYDIVFP